jgi:hypothetical protein
MAKNRFVQPETVRLPLTDGDWIDVKARLSIGEKKSVDSAGLKTMKTTGDDKGDVVVDLSAFSLARTETYLVGWSFVDDDGRPVKLSREAIRALSEESYEEVENAITAHVEAETKKRQTPTGELSSKAS